MQGRVTLTVYMYVIYINACMKQLNLNIKPELQKDLDEYMRRMKIAQKSEAIRRALHEVVEQLRHVSTPVNYLQWLGTGLKTPPNRHPRFKNEKSLWES